MLNVTHGAELWTGFWRGKLCLKFLFLITKPAIEWAAVPTQRRRRRSGFYGKESDASLGAKLFF